MVTNNTTSELLIRNIAIKAAAGILRSINHQLRQQILRVLHQNGRMTVTQLYTTLRLEQSVASQHLAVLRKAGIVTTQRDKKFVSYAINYSRLQEIQHNITSLLSPPGATGQG